MTGKTKAEQLFDAEFALLKIEAEMEDILPEGWEDYSYDYYDRSIEIYNIHRDLTPEELKPLKDFGFANVWTHARLMGTPRNTDAEKHYALWGMEGL